MRILAPVPTHEDLIPLLKEALADNCRFEYKRVPWGQSYYVPRSSIVVLIEVLDWLDHSHKSNFLDLVPLHMDELIIRCWEIKTDPFKYQHMLRAKGPIIREYHQYEFDFTRRKDDARKFNSIFDEGCPLCRHKTH